MNEDNTRHPVLLGLAASHPELVEYLHDLQKRIEALEVKDGGWRKT